MSVQWKERVLAALVPSAMLITFLLSPFVVGVIPALFYFLLRKRANPFAATHALRLFDLFISTVALFFGISLLIKSFSSLIRDGLDLPLNIILVISTGFGYAMFAVFVYIGLISALHFVFALLGRELKVPFVLRPFEALRGKRSVKKDKAEPNSETAISTP